MNTDGVDEIWSADPVFMDKLSKRNKGFKYILTVLDLFSKFAWTIPLNHPRVSEYRLSDPTSEVSRNS